MGGRRGNNINITEQNSNLIGLTVYFPSLMMIGCCSSPSPLLLRRCLPWIPRPWTITADSGTLSFGSCPRSFLLPVTPLARGTVAGAAPLHLKPVEARNRGGGGSAGPATDSAASPRSKVGAGAAPRHPCPSCGLLIREQTYRRHLQRARVLLSVPL